jgi:hypothetical protein
MKTKIEANADVGYSDVSLIRGGPFYHIPKAVRLIPTDRWDFHRQITLSLSGGRHCS